MNPIDEDPTKPRTRDAFSRVIHNAFPDFGEAVRFAPQADFGDVGGSAGIVGVAELLQPRRMKL